MSSPELSPDELTELLSGLTPEIPDCRVLRLIGRGGMSFVYLGVQESLDRQVAIKVIAPHALKDEVSKARFEREARTIAKLQHPCIVAIHAVGRSEQGLLFYLLPYFNKGHLGQRDLTGNDAGVIEVVRALLWALDYAHAHGVVHRDVKAENVLFDNADRPLLADFGIAATRRDRARMTQDGLAVGSAAHMAPEQARAEQVDGRADIYSLGVLTFEMVTGRLPFQSVDDLGLAVMHAVDPVPRLPVEKQHWQAFIDKAMAKLPRDRFQDAREMMAALERVVDQVRRASEARARPDRLGALRAWATSRRRALAMGAAAGVAMAAAVMLWSFWPSRSALPPRDLAITTTHVETPAAVPAAAPPAPIASPDVDAPPVAAESADVAEPIELAPGQQELAAAQQQIVRRRLTQPPGDNAFDSLLAAHRIVPDTPELARAGQRWLAAAKPYIASGLSSGKEDAARTLFARATTLADELSLRDSTAWSELDGTVLAAFSTRLQTALTARDPEALRQAKATASQWNMTPARLEPHWSQALVVARRGDLLKHGSTAMVLTRLPSSAQSGLAVMPHAVTRQAYAEFVRATGHASARCRIRTARVTLKRRTWDRPGFAQQGDHPVVCVSAADVAAYAAWLGQRDGQRYRLPSGAEWRSLGLSRAASACGGRCEGTAAVDRSASIDPGLRSHVGSAREWTADCREGCRQHVQLGSSWRDAAPKPGTPSADAVDSDDGYDDIGFRLVREVSAGELASR